MVASIAVVGLVSCQKDYAENHHNYTNEKGSFLYFGENGTTDTELKVTTEGYIGANSATSATYEMYTDYDHWTIVPDYSQCFFPEKEWIDIWPTEGRHDGRIRIQIQPNVDQGETRYAKINIISEGKIVQTIDVQQAQSQNVQLFIQSFLRNLTFAADDTTVRSVPLTANVFWDCSIPDDVDWVNVSIKSNSQFEVSVEPNYGAARKATVTVYQVNNPNNTQMVIINQNGVDDAPEA